MKSDFSQPQRQSLIGIVVLFGDALQNSVRAFLPILLVTLLKGDSDIQKLWLYGGIILVITLIIGYLNYLNFRFFVDEDTQEFVVSKGILKKTRIGIPLDKIQQVNINQSLLQKIIGVHALEVDTAGSNKKEIIIKAISHEHALILKERLLQSTDAFEEVEETNTETAVSPKKQKPFIEVSLLSLLKTGITSNYIRSFGLLLAFFISTLQHLDELFKYGNVDDKVIEEYVNTDVVLRFVSFIIFAIIFLTLMVNLVRTIVRYYNFRVTKEQNSLLLSHGLINTRNTIIRPEKVQIVTVGRNYFQKKFDINDVKVRQASDLESSNKEQQKSAIEIPGCSEAEKNMLLQFLLEKMPERGFAVKPNFRKMIFETFKFLIIPIGIFFLFAYYVLPETIEYVVFVPIYSVFVGVLIFFAFKNSRLFITPDFIIKQSGAWDIDNDYVAPHKIQAIKLKQFFWQKSSDVGIVNLYTAGGTVSFGLANFTQLKKLANYWLYQVETTEKNWM
ncbi:PH domain-containing protein [Flavobacterium sp. Sd200]|uniref:PH domain-containing protein n=1 Tax=Flavobacterium sp. Sd200 TaxID=2692211 RepID=UPI00136BCA82|nr:PH domain-containing protein [Flavobacterium sp. Sd200]MXN90393.1 PH domain-containing protein [Flavobacterium sp. Sd200]